MKGQAIRSCITPVGSVGDSEITTLEGLGTVDTPHPIQRAFIEEQAVQCGFCLSGVILTAKTFLDRNQKATDGGNSGERYKPVWCCAEASGTPQWDSQRENMENRSPPSRPTESGSGGPAERGVAELKVRHFHRR